MSPQKPQVPETHENDDEAYINLRSHFQPWPITDNRGSVNKREYGIDFIIKLLDENRELIGAEFAVQSKIIQAKQITSRRVKCKIKMTTARYLMDYPLPVMIHVYH